MQVKFWGVRGSTPTPQAENLRYGGNTSCVEVRIGDQIDSTSILTGGGTLSMASRVVLASGVAAAAESLERPRQSQ